MRGRGVVCRAITIMMAVVMAVVVLVVVVMVVILGRKGRHVTHKVQACPLSSAHGSSVQER